MNTKTQGIGQLINKLHSKREEIRALMKDVKILEEERDELAERLITAMDAQGIELSRGDIATATVTESVVPQVEDWDRFYTYIARNKAYHLLERRPAVVAFRETLEVRKGKKIPGVSSFKKRTIRLLTKKNS